MKNEPFSWYDSRESRTQPIQRTPSPLSNEVNLMTIKTARVQSAIPASFSSIIIAGFLSFGLLAASTETSLAAGLTDTARVTRAIGHYDSIVSKASNLYHKAISDARKKFDMAKSKADGSYDKATEVANREVTFKINTIKESISQAQGFDANLKDKIKQAAQDFAVSIAKARAIHQAALAEALKNYTESLKSVTASYAQAVEKAEATYRSEAHRWIQ
jgi:hypothetical protein